MARVALTGGAYQARSVIAAAQRNAILMSEQRPLPRQTRKISSSRLGELGTGFLGAAKSGQFGYCLRRKVASFQMGFECALREHIFPRVAYFRARGSGVFPADPGRGGSGDCIGRHLFSGVPCAQLCLTLRCMCLFPEVRLSELLSGLLGNRVSHSFGGLSRSAFFCPFSFRVYQMQCVEPSVRRIVEVQPELLPDINQRPVINDFQDRK